MRIMFFVVFCTILSGCSTLDIKPIDYQAKWEEAAYREKQPDDLMQMSQRVEFDDFKIILTNKKLPPLVLGAFDGG